MTEIRTTYKPGGPTGKGRVTASGGNRSATVNVESNADAAHNAALRAVMGKLGLKARYPKIVALEPAQRVYSVGE